MSSGKIYKLGFLAEALKEWRKLDANTRQQFKKKLTERLENPRVPAAKLSGVKDRYKTSWRVSATGWSMKSVTPKFWCW